MSDEKNKPTTIITGAMNATLGPVVVTMPTDTQGNLYRAKELLAGARALQGKVHDFALVFLCAHATELLLKAYLRHNDLSDKEMKDVGHKLRELWELAIDHRLPWYDTAPPTWLELMHTLHARPYHLRYNDDKNGMITPAAEPLLTDLETLTSRIDDTIMSTIGYGSLAPGTRLAHYVMTLQAVTNIVLVALFTGITFAKFSRPTARVLFTHKAVVSMRDGVPHLMVRMANWRHNQVVEAQLRMVIIALETTKEGDVLRRPVELKLVRDRTPFFLLTFTAMHVIDETSPFFDKERVEKYRADRADLIMSFSGLDETLGQQIHARHVYAIDDIVWGAHFSNVLTILPDGAREIDYTQFHEIVLETPA